MESKSSKSYGRSNRQKGPRRSKEKAKSKFPVTRFTCYPFSRGYLAASLTVMSTSFSIEPSINLTNTSSDLTVLFDQARIIAAKILIVPTTNVGYAATSGTAFPIPSIFYTEDNDGNGPDTVATFMQRGVTPVMLDRPREFHIRTPRARLEVFDGAGAAPIGNAPLGSWFDLVSTSPIYYGGYFLLSSTPPTGWTADVFVVVHLECRSQR